MVLDPQWVIDAVTCFIRDFKLEDHTKGHRTHALDQKAIREEPEAWEMLTKGKATLQHKLLNILWSGEDFKEHKPVLLDLITRFGLAIPLRSGNFLIPALLPTQEVAGLADTPAASSAQMRIFFFLDGHASGGSSLMCSPHDLSEGFLPVGVFHRLCAGALSCSYEEANRFEPSLTFRQARIAMHESLVTLSFKQSESSIHVAITSKNVRDGSAANVFDRLRVLLVHETSIYANLRYRMLAHVEGTETMVDLDELPKANATQRIVVLRGEQVGIEALKDELAFWHTTQCVFNFIDARRLRADSSEKELPKMVSLQELRKTKSDWIVQKTISLEQVLRGTYVSEICTLSYRWCKSDDPDPDGEQLAVVREYVRKHPSITFVFIDFLCLAQGERTSKDKIDFFTMLPNMYLLYLGTSVLVCIISRQYMERFWTQLVRRLHSRAAPQTRPPRSPSASTSAAPRRGRRHGTPSARARRRVSSQRARSICETRSCACTSRTPCSRTTWRTGGLIATSSVRARVLARSGCKSSTRRTRCCSFRSSSISSSSSVAFTSSRLPPGAPKAALARGQHGER